MSDIKYNRIDEDLQQKIISNRESHWINPYAFKDEMAVRRNNDIDKANLWRPVFVRDVEKIMHLPYYNRYADKTQVFSFKNNDDITRRAQHVQLVSRIARNIGSVLGLNLDLIEAIALGHYYVFEWYDGKSLKDGEIKSVHCEKIGEVLAKIHNIDLKNEPFEKDEMHIDWQKYIELAKDMNSPIYDYRYNFVNKYLEKIFYG